MCSIIRKHDESIVAALEAGLYDVLERLNNYPENAEVVRVAEILTLFSCLVDDERGTVRRKLMQKVHHYRWESRVVWPKEGVRIVPFPGPNLTKANKWEHDAVSALLRTMPEDGKHRIRPCADKDCPRWFYAAKRIDQRFCIGGNCKQHNHENDPDKRAKKAKHMREQRLMLKLQALNKKSGVGLRAKSRKAT